jgi:lysophospholipase L1-like esterase
VQRALEAKPTFVSIWIGNNDVLTAALSGVLTPLAGVSPGITPIPAFTTNYGTMIAQLTASATLQGGVLIGVVNVASDPVLFPASLLVNSPQVKGAFDAAVGTTTTIHSSCTATTTSLISLTIIPQIQLYLTDPRAAGAHPPLIVCEKNQAGVPAPLGDIFVLDATEQEELAATVSGYNAAIHAKANELGWAYYDPNPTLEQLRTEGLIPIFPNLQDPTKPFGDYVSLDGIHPAAAAHVLTANALITTINAQYSTHIPAIPSP